MRKLTWTDETGHQWSCVIKFSDAIRLRANEIDLFNAERIGNLFGDTLTTIEFIGELSRPQFESRGLSYESFADLLIEGDCHPRAMEALQHGLADFFRHIGRPALALVIERAWESAMALQIQSVRNVAGAKTDQLMEAMRTRSQAEFDVAVEKEIAKLQTLGS